MESFGPPELKLILNHIAVVNGYENCRNLVLQSPFVPGLFKNLLLFGVMSVGRETIFRHRTSSSKRAFIWSSSSALHTAFVMSGFCPSESGRSWRGIHSRATQSSMYSLFVCIKNDAVHGVWIPRVQGAIKVLRFPKGSSSASKFQFVPVASHVFCRNS